MSFHSVEYLLFLPAAVAAFFLTPHGWRWLVLLAASVIFYASWRIEFLSLLVFSTVLDYTAGLAMPRASQRKKNVLLGISLIGNLGLLGYFKFFADDARVWFNASVAGGEEALTPMLFLLPLGISFYTFQTLSYTIDVYRGKREPERHLGHFATYVMFFPQLIAGPIERFGVLMPQLKREQTFDLLRTAGGCALILVGLFKKLVIADGLAPWIARVMEAGNNLSGLDLTVVAIGNAYRYYCDLSGYADIAIGSALIFGVRLTQNFRRPFAANSVTVLWQRWHITVTNWFRDYLYIPLVKRIGHWRYGRPVVTTITLIVIGVWHGATWNWLTIGLLAGIIIGVSNYTRKALATGSHQAPWRKRAFDIGERVVLWIYIPIMGMLVLVREPGPAWSKIWLMAQSPLHVIQGKADMPIHPGVVLVLAVIALELYQWFDAREAVFARLVERGRCWSWSFYLALIAAILVLGTYGNPDFLYFEF